MIYKDKHEMIRTLINKNDIVLDVGFWGQGVDRNNERWPHSLIKESARDVYGVDVEIAPEFIVDPTHYKIAAAEDVYFDVKFSKIFAGDLIEHLVNPGLFLASCRKMLTSDGELILTTPNTFNLFNLTEKLTKTEPTVNPDHTFYFNHKVLRVLLQKCDFEITSVAYVYKLDMKHKESGKKKVLNLIYWSLALFTDKFAETLVVVAQSKSR